MEKKRIAWDVPGVSDRFVYGKSFYDDFTDNTWDPGMLDPMEIATGLYFTKNKFLTSAAFLARKETAGYVVTYCVPDGEQVAVSGVFRHEVPSMIANLIESRMQYIAVLHSSDGVHLPRGLHENMNLF